MKYNSYYLYRRYERRDSQDVLPSIPSVYSIDGNGTMPKVIHTSQDPTCGDIPPIYRWTTIDINSDYWCDLCSGTSVDYKIKGVLTDDTSYGVLCDSNTNLEGYVPRDAKTAEIGKCISYIGANSFSSVTNTLESVYIPPTVATIQDRTFKNTRELIDCVVPKNLTTIGQAAFQDVITLHNIDLWDDITEIGSSAFSNCNSITSIHIPSGLTTIRAFCFQECDGFISIRIPRNIKTIEGKAFYKNGLELLYGCGGVTSMAMEAFAECKKLTEAFFEEGLTVIGFESFRDCINLKKVNLPDSVTTIDTKAFSGCTSLGIVDIKPTSKLTTIGNSAFTNTSLTELYIPSGVTSLNTTMFKPTNDLNMLTEITVHPNNEYYDSRDNCNAIIVTSANTLFLGSSSTIIPDSVTSIGDYAFYRCTGLTGNFVFHSGITSIGTDAFWDCSGLTSLTFYSPVPPRLSYSEHLPMVNTPPFPPSIIVYVPCEYFDVYRNAGGFWASNRHNIRIIPGTCGSEYKFISKYFADPTYSAMCYNYTISESDVKNETTPSVSGMGEVIITDCVRLIDKNAFQECTRLSSVTISNTVTEIGEKAFYNCYSLPSIIIPDSVEYIRSSAFTYCNALTNVEIGSEIKGIGNSAFRNTNLNTLTIHATTPPGLGQYAFANIKYCTIYVPSGSVYAYKNNEEWSQYAGWIYPIP